MWMQFLFSYGCERGGIDIGKRVLSILCDFGSCRKMPRRLDGTVVGKTRDLAWRLKSGTAGGRFFPFSWGQAMNINRRPPKPITTPPQSLDYDKITKVI